MQCRLMLPGTVNCLASFICMQACIIQILLNDVFLFPKYVYIYEVLLECPSLSCTSLTMLFAAGPRARMVLLSRFQSCFSLDGYQSEQIDKGQRIETLFRRNEGQSVAWQQVFCSASSSRNTMTCSA